MTKAAAARAGFLRALKMAFWVYYDHVVLWTALNVLVVVCVLLPLILAGGFASGRLSLWGASLLLSGAMACVGYAGLLHLARRIIETGGGTWRDFVEGCSGHGPRMILLLIPLVGFWMSILWGIRIHAGVVAKQLPLLAHAALGAGGLLAFLTAGVALFAGPALVNRGCRPGSALGTAWCICLVHPCYATCAWAVVGVLGAAGLFPPWGALASIGPVSVFIAASYEMLARLHDLPEGDEAWSTACRHWDRTDDFLNRGIRDFLYPWKN